MKLFKPNQKFHESVVHYQSLDGLLAIGLFGVVCALYALLAVLQTNYPIMQEKSMAVGCAFNLLLIGLTILLIKMRKGDLSSIGLYGGNWKQSCIIGVIGAAILFFNNCLSHIIGGASFIKQSDMIQFSVYYLTVALCEEIVFRGYIGTRLYGLLKNEYLVILVNGVFFTVMHFPYRMVAYGMSLSDLTIHRMGWLVDLFITHTVLSFIYLKTNSLYGAILPHWMSNLAYNLVAR